MKKKLQFKQTQDKVMGRKVQANQADPVRCARYFDYRFQRFFHENMCNSTHPIGEIADFFYRM